MELILSGLSCEVALVYLDNMIIFGRTFEEHPNPLDLVPGQSTTSRRWFECKGLKIFICEGKIHILGQIVSNEGVDKDPEKLAAVSTMKSLHETKMLEALLGLVGFYRKFIQCFGKTAEPLSKLVNKNERFSCNECESAIEQLKQALHQAPHFDLYE